MATSLGELFVQLGLKDAEFKKKLKDVESRLDGISKTAKPIAAASATAFAGLAAGLTGVVKAADEQRSAELRLQAAIRGTGQAIDVNAIKSYAAELQRVTQFGDEATIAASAMLTTFNLNQKQVMDLIPRVQNLAAMYGMDLKQAAITVGRALTSGAGALSRYGITMTEAEKKAFNMGTQMQKVNILMSSLDKNTGPAARTLANTASGAFKQMTNAAGDIAEQLGFIVEGPIVDGLKNLTGIFSNVVTWLKSLDDSTKKWIAKITIGTTVVAGLIAGLSGFAVLLPFIISGFAAMASAVAALAVPVIVVSAALGIVILTIGLVKRAWDKNIGGMRETMNAFAEGVSGVWRRLVNFYKEGWDGLMDFIKSSVIPVLESLGVISPEKALEMIETINKGFGEIELDEKIKDGFEEGKKTAKSIGKELLASLKAGGKVIFDKIKEALPELDVTFEKFKDAVSQLTRTGVAVGGAGARGEIAGPAMPKALVDGMSKAAVAAETFAERVRDSGKVIGNIFAKFGNKMLDASGEVGSFVRAVAEGAKQGGLWGAIIAAFGELIKRTEGFQKSLEHGTEILDVLAQIISPISQFIADITEMLMPLIKLLGKLGWVIRVILAIATFGASEAVRRRNEKVTQAHEELVNAVQEDMNAIAEHANALRDAAYALREFEKSITDELVRAAIDAGKSAEELQAAMEAAGISADAISDAMDAFAVEEDRMEAINKGLESMGLNADGASSELETFSDEVNKATQAMINVPHGYKVALARFEALGSNLSQIGLGGMVGGAGTTAAVGTTNIFESVTVVTNDPRQFYENLKDLARWDNMVNTGSPLAANPNTTTG